jgi:hypothetical protein
MYATPINRPGKPDPTRPVTSSIAIEAADQVAIESLDARYVIHTLDTLSAAQMRALSTPDLRKLESLCWHWASLSENELNERRRMSREEESE